MLGPLFVIVSDGEALTELVADAVCSGALLAWAYAVFVSVVVPDGMSDET